MRRGRKGVKREREEGEGRGEGERGREGDMEGREAGRGISRTAGFHIVMPHVNNS